MKTPAFICFVTCTLFLAVNAAAQEHTISYDKRKKSIGAQVNIAGQPYTIVKVPVREFATGDKYTVTYAADTVYNAYVSGRVTANHTSAPLMEPNITIDGYPANYVITDGISYTMSGNGSGGNVFIATGLVGITVTIDIGDTQLVLNNVLEIPDPGTGMAPITYADIGTSSNAVPYANWKKYKDPVDLVDALDKWIDFIRIKPK